jgi:hypothetical protein
VCVLVFVCVFSWENRMSRILPCSRADPENWLVSPGVMILWLPDQKPAIWTVCLGVCLMMYYVYIYICTWVCIGVYVRVF